MKHSILLALAFMMCLGLHAQTLYVPGNVQSSNNGNVGIGTQDPTATLHVNGDIAWGSSGSKLSPAGTIELKGAGTPYIDFSNSSADDFDARIMLKDDNKLGLTGANFGVGTNSPLSLLSIYKANVGTNTDGLDHSLLYLNNGNERDGSIVIKSHGAHKDEVIGALKFHSSPDALNYSQSAIKALANQDATANALAFYTASSNSQQEGTEVMRIQGDRIGILTPNPDAKLTVNGDIHAKEVRVDLNFPAPDYVFQPDYSLVPLVDVKKYIQENHHLSEVPSATEMEENGIDVASMNMLLLKKVEELTLYLIKQNEINQKQAEEIEALKERLLNLEQ
ncbi:hypothetical protein [Fulvivirga ligni]|uniref:hypothetical protein n=1 Tax=Fulvivirga ligni TaxID=2904246 RepID=UPI001F31FC60|nr:hypothetical protein [Fulvivirga ligni]UII22652.1 hypothetical protein LVD16_05355 [Fulvivirga ligni]